MHGNPCIAFEAFEAFSRKQIPKFSRTTFAEAAAEGGSHSLRSLFAEANPEIQPHNLRGSSRGRRKQKTIQALLVEGSRKGFAEGDVSVMTLFRNKTHGSCFIIFHNFSSCLIISCSSCVYIYVHFSNIQMISDNFSSFSSVFTIFVSESRSRVRHPSMPGPQPPKKNTHTHTHKSKKNPARNLHKKRMRTQINKINCFYPPRTAEPTFFGLR